VASLRWLQMRGVELPLDDGPLDAPWLLGAIFFRRFLYISRFKREM